MPNLHTQLRSALERRKTIWSEAEKILEEAATRSDQALTAEERDRWDAIEGDISTLDADVERFQRAIDRDAQTDLDLRDDDRDGEDRDGDPEVAEYRDAFDAYVRRGLSGLNAEQREAMDAEFRAMSTGVGAEGGYTIPEGFRNKITEAMKAYGGMAEVAEVITTATGNPLPWPTNDDTANIGELLDENTAVGTQDVAFGTKRLGAYTFTSKMVTVPVQLLQDSAFNMDAWLPGKLGTRLGRIHNQLFTVGTGTDQPQGLVTGATVGHTGAAGQVDSITYEDLIELEHSVDPAYRNNAGWMFADPMLKALRLLVDQDGRPLWQPSVIAGVASTLNGRPYTVNQDVPVPAASAKSLLFGDFRAAYVIRLALSMQMIRLTERYAEKLQVGFFAYDRADGLVQDAAAVKAYAHPAI